MPLDERSEAYFNQERKNMGLLVSYDGHKGVEDILKQEGYFDISGFKEIRRYANFINGMNDLVIYSYNVGKGMRYCAEVGYPCGIDDYNVEKHIFSRIPSLNDVTLVRSMSEFELDLRIMRKKAEYRCWECGRTVHWADNSGDFGEKVEKLREEYCGC